MGNGASSSQVIRLWRFEVKFASEDQSVVVFAEKEASLREKKKKIPLATYSTVIETDYSVSADPEGGIVGLCLWPGAVAFSSYLLANPELVQGKAVLELGCGVGLPSLVMGKFLNPKNVILTDRSSLRTPVELGVHANQLHEICSFEPFDWGCSDDLAIFRSKNFDLVVATEVVYAEEMAPLLNALLAATACGDPIVLLFYTLRSDPDREYLERLLEQFSLLARNDSVFVLKKRGVPAV